MNVRLTIALLASAAVVAIGSGCGGGSDSASSAEQTDLSKAVFVKRANAACSKESKNLIEDVEAYGERRSSEHLPEGVSVANTVKAVVLPIVEAEIAAIRRLEGPPQDRKQIEAMLVAQQSAVDEVKKLKSLKSFEEVEDHFSKAAKQLKGYGLTACTTG